MMPRSTTAIGEPANVSNGRATAERDSVLSVQGLRTYFDTPAGVVKAVDDVSFELNRGDILAIVGESGSGKSVTAQSIMKLIPTPPGRYVGGRVLFDGRDLLSLHEKELQRVRGERISMIFQNPRASLNPSLMVQTQVVETLRRHDATMSEQDAKQRTIAILRAVGFPDPDRVARSYPHQLSGGMCQRVGLALSMACEPQVLIADEPTTALDVLVQATILLMLKRMHRERDLPIILITHDFSVVRAMANRVIVMYAGRVQESGSTRALLSEPQHPYTKALIDSVPNPDRPRSTLYQIRGQPPDLTRLPHGCSFADRCEYAMPVCRTNPPSLYVSPTGSAVRCHLFSGALSGDGGPAQETRGRS